MNKFVFGTHDYRNYYVNIDLRHQYGISVSESQTFAKRPLAVMSEEKRLPFAGYPPPYKRGSVINICT